MIYKIFGSTTKTSKKIWDALVLTVAILGLLLALAFAFGFLPVSLIVLGKR